MTREEAIQILRTQYPHDAVIKEALGLLVPELRESEDETHRKWILEYLYDGLRKADEQFKDHFKSAIDWLEKQKDAFENGRQLGIMQEQARQELEWPDEKHKEQKPAEWSLQDARPGDVLTTGAVTFIFKSADGDFANAYCYFSEMTGKFGISETAEIYLKHVQPASIEQRVRLYEHLLRYIRIHTQEEHWKPSEEDEKILHAIELHINQLDSGETINGFSSSDMLQVLKSLRPQPKQEWSEEDERILKGIIGKIDHDQTYGVSKAEMLSFLEGLRPSWKPSEEQGDALVFAIKAFRDRTPIRDNLLSLYNDLKKL